MTLIKTTNDSHWLRFGNPQQSSSFTGDFYGKYLFFSSSKFTLIKIALTELKYYKFNCAKVSQNPVNKAYVLCIYDNDDKRKHELAARYKNKSNCAYRYFKKNSDTRKGKYSKQYKDWRKHS